MQGKTGKKIERKKKRCGCVFCNSKCPKCGSTKIHVEFVVRWKYDNDTEDRIELRNPEDSLQLYCRDCHSSFEYGYWVQEVKVINGHEIDLLRESNRVLAPLSKALWRHFGMSDDLFIEHTEKGKIESTKGILVTSRQKKTMKRPQSETTGK